eukprot:m.173308 g.173308  ORF g.173308 m.173308 type:complete len:130 (+) comp13676_c0_seq1:143-532(+)
MSSGQNMCGANGAGLPPPWLTGDIERPAGERTDGSATFLVYTEEQQARLGVDAQGKKVSASTASQPPAQPSTASQPPMHCGGKDVRPRWVREGLEPPAGEVSMGTWNKAVYTEEQQKRFGVDEKGEPIQ